MGQITPAVMTEAEAFAAVALGAVACDGVLGRDEAHALRRHLEHRTPYKNNSESEMAALFDGLLAVLREQGLEQLVDQALPQLNLDQQETALALATQLVHADRSVDPAETAFLETLTRKVDLPDSRANGIVEAIMALNRDSLLS